MIEFSRVVCALLREEICCDCTWDIIGLALLGKTGVVSVVFLVLVLQRTVPLMRICPSWACATGAHTPANKNIAKRKVFKAIVGDDIYQCIYAASCKQVVRLLACSFLCVCIYRHEDALFLLFLMTGDGAHLPS